MKIWRWLLPMLILATPAAAQSIYLKDGKIVATKGIRREGDNIIATVEIAAGEPGKPAKTGDLGYPLAQILRLDFPEPKPLRSTPELIATGHGGEALNQLEPIVRYYEGFRDAPGSWWAPAALLKAQALTSLGRSREADAVVEQVSRSATDPEIRRAANVQLAAALARKGAHAQALEICETALKESREPGTRASAAVTRGECLLARKDWEDALLSFLQVPVFYPGERILLPASLLGSGRAHFGMDHFADAKTALNELIKTYGGSAAAREAKAELEKIARREKALAPAR